MSVSILQASPLARGLFQHVVGMSGSAVANDAVAGPRSLAAAERDGERLQEDLHAADLTAMRNLPADRILYAPVMGRPGTGQLHYGAVIDGSVLPASPLEIFTAGKQNDVPTLIGFVRDESFSELGRVFTLTDFQDRARKLYGDKADELLKLYPARDDAQRPGLARIGQDGMLVSWRLLNVTCTEVWLCAPLPRHSL